MRDKIKWFDVIFLVIFIVCFLCLVNVLIKLMLERFTLSYVGLFYLLGISGIMILSGDYIIDRVIDMLNNDD